MVQFVAHHCIQIVLGFAVIGLALSITFHEGLGTAIFNGGMAFLGGIVAFGRHKSGYSTRLVGLAVMVFFALTAVTFLR